MDSQGDTVGYEFLEGNEAVARGAMKAGCTFFAGYPITPASSILQVGEALQRLPTRFPDRKCLAAFSPAEIEMNQDLFDEVLHKRARHVATEVERIDEAVDALRHGQVARLGELITQSHESSRVDYEVSCDELDWLVTNLCRIDGVYGARLTGAGFGGCVIALERPGAVTSADRKSIEQGYIAEFGREPEFLFLRLGKPPCEIV